MHQQWRVVIGMRDERQFMPDQVAQIPGPHAITLDALKSIYAYLDLIYDNIYYFSMDYYGNPTGNDKGRVEVFLENGKIESVLYDEGYKYMCNHFDNAGLKDIL